MWSLKATAHDQRTAQLNLNMRKRCQLDQTVARARARVCVCLCVLSYAKLYGKTHQKITAEDREVTEKQNNGWKGETHVRRDKGQRDELISKRSITLLHCSQASSLSVRTIRYKASHSSKLHCKTSFLPRRKHESPVQRPSYIAVKVKVKLKFTLKQAMKAHSGSRCIRLRFL